MQMIIRVEGLAALAHGLRQLPQRLQTNVVRGALRAGANVIANEARLRCPTRTGQLKASIRVSSRVINGRIFTFVKAGERFRVFKIGSKGKRTKDPYRTAKADGSFAYHAAFYAHWVEFGHYAGTGSRKVFVQARPFMRPAFEVKKMEAVDAIAGYIRERLDSELAAIRVGG